MAEHADHPDGELAARVLPAPLHRALVHVFAQEVADCMLVGGTALAGYYAGHRSSDDLDLFVRNAPAHQATVLAVRSLATLGARFDARQHTPQFFDSTCMLDSHAFTIQVVLDEGVFGVGHATRASDGVHVAGLETLLRQKAATLVSRCSEKDLYDLLWLFGRFPALAPERLLELGASIDPGMTTESVLLSLTGATLRESACGFSPTQSAREVFHDVVQLRETLATAFDQLARRQPVGPMGELIRRLK